MSIFQCPRRGGRRWRRRKRRERESSGLSITEGLGHRPREEEEEEEEEQEDPRRLRLKPGRITQAGRESVDTGAEDRGRVSAEFAVVAETVGGRES